MGSAPTKVSILASGGKGHGAAKPGNGAGSAPPDRKEPEVPPCDSQCESQDDGVEQSMLPPAIEQEPDPPVPQTRGRAGKDPQPPNNNARLNKILPEAERIYIEKRMADGSYAFLCELTMKELESGGGRAEVFIARYRREHLDPGLNYFHVTAKLANGRVREHGEVKVMGPTTPEQQPPSP